jgi:hypothetical protein
MDEAERGRSPFLILIRPTHDNKKELVGPQAVRCICRPRKVRSDGRTPCTQHYDIDNINMSFFVELRIHCLLSFLVFGFYRELSCI